MKRFGPRAVFTVIANHCPRRRVLALAPALLILALAIGATAFAPEDTPPVDVTTAMRSMVERGRPLFDTPTRPEPDRKLGSFKLSYYWMPSEESGRRSVSLYTKSCKRIAKVSRPFSKKLQLEGGGKLLDGRVLIYAGKCSCSGTPCYKVAHQSHEWGTGVQDRPLSPFRSVAVDPSRVSIGTVMYVPELDGLTMPGHDPYGGFIHDGCVVADDRGGGIRGRQIDLFAAKQIHYSALNRRHRLKKVTVFQGGERCKTYKNRAAARRGDG
jgi:3D (Asp-Asp-Asp) domain-containing protein